MLYNNVNYPVLTKCIKCNKPFYIDQPDSRYVCKKCEKGEKKVNKTSSSGSSFDGGGERKNEGKLRMDLVPVSSINALAEVLTFGAQKYSERNWERGMKYSVPYACLMRHITKWWKGEENDNESNLNHLKHALCNIAMLIEYEEKKPHSLDDRPGTTLAVDKSGEVEINYPEYNGYAFIRGGK